MAPAADGTLPSLRSPDDVLLVTAGGEGAGLVGWLPSWAPTIHAYRATRRVRPSGEPLPECGPDGCIVPWAMKLTVLRPDVPRARRRLGDVRPAPRPRTRR